MFHSLQESRKESKALNDFLNADDGRLEKSMRNLGVGLMSSEEVLMSKTKLKINTEAAKKFKIENHDRIVAKVRKENRILQARKRIIHLLNGTCQSKATEVLKTELYRYMALLEISPILLFRFSDGLFELIVFRYLFPTPIFFLLPVKLDGVCMHLRKTVWNTQCTDMVDFFLNG